MARRKKRECCWKKVSREFFGNAAVTRGEVDVISLSPSELLPRGCILSDNNAVTQNHWSQGLVWRAVLYVSVLFPLCSLVEAVCQVYREGDCSDADVWFGPGWPPPALLLWLTHRSCLLISTSIMAQYQQLVRVGRQRYAAIKKPQSLRQRPWILLLCGFHHHIYAIYFTTSQKVSYLPNNVNKRFEWKSEKY